MNPDIEEHRIFMKLAQEIVSHCELEDITYAEREHYTLLHIFSKAMTSRTVKEVKRDFPCMMDMMSAIDNLYRVFDWPSLAIVVDQLRGRSLIKLEVS
ncbi:hypothetical protein D3C75_327590 [compost metagenome]